MSVINKPAVLVLGAALTMVGGTAGASVFQARELSGGYMLADNHGDKSAEAKCGAQEKNAEAKCGDEAKKSEEEADSKMKEGACGEGRCGAAQ